MSKASGSRKPGGGLGSRVVREVPVRVGDRAKVVNPRAVSQVGQALGNKATDSAGKTVRPAETMYGAREPEGGPGGVPLGNSLATNVGGGGPGAGRKNYGQSGTNCVTGPVNPGLGRITDTRGTWPDTNTKRQGESK
jgi:hypothetical protein